MLCLFHLCASSSGVYPEMVNTSEVYNANINERNSFPYIDNRDYLNSLAIHCSQEISLSVMVVVGPKDSGKSEGIAQMERLWMEAGHIVLDLNLKGKHKHVEGNDAMKFLSFELIQQFQDVEYDTYFKIHECMSRKCQKRLSIGNQMIRTFLSIRTVSFLGTIGTIFALLTGDRFRNLLQMRWALRLFIFIIMVIGILAIVAIAVLVIYPYLIYEALNPLDVSLQLGDWDALICFLNCISIEKPESRPILIIRELINFSPESLQECLRAMERMKKKGIQFPIILETSDCSWSETLAVKRSSLSFEPYYIKEMTYEEGEKDMIEMGLYTSEEYKVIYNKLGGHIGSYVHLWHTIRSTNGTINSSLEALQMKAVFALEACLLAKPELDYESALKDLQTHNFSIHITKGQGLIPPLKHLIDCKILFFDGLTVVPCKNLMKHAIIEVMKH